MTTPDILLAAIIAAQGLKGEVRVKTFTDTLEAYDRLHAKDGRVFTLVAARPTKPGEAVVAFAELRDRSAAEALKGTELFVARGALPACGEDEFYHADLVGMRAIDGEGRTIGTVAGIQNYGAGDVLAIAVEGGEVLIAFTRANVPDIDLGARRLVVALPDEVDARGEGGVE